MIKPVSSSVLRNSVLALFIAGSMGVKAENSVSRNNYVTEPNRTELISKAGAEAVKVNSIQVVNQSEVPTVHNTKLDTTIRKFIEDDNDRKSINGLIDNSYTNFGTFLGTACIQHELNTRVLYTFMTGNTKLLKDKNIAPKFADKIDSYGEDFYKTVKPNARTVLQWAVADYTPYFNSKFQFDHKPTADEVLSKIDNIISNESALTNEEKNDIRAKSLHYRITSLDNRKDTQSMADFIAFKINLYDTYMFWHELRAAGIYNDGYFRESDKNIKSFYLEWMDKVNPDKVNKSN